MTADVISLPGRRRPPRVEFGDRLRLIRRDLDMGQVEFAEYLGVGRQAYAAWEAGRTKPRDLAGVAELLEAKTGVHRNWFMGWPIPDDTDGGPGAGVGEAGFEPATFRVETRPFLAVAA